MGMLIGGARSRLKRTLAAIDGQSLVIASTSFGGDLMNSLFSFYYIKVFLTIYYLNERWLNVVQILFAIWNAVNDPLFGCMQDVGCSFCPRWVTNRRKVVLYVGPLYALSFMIFWIPWTIESPDWLVGLQLLTGLFLFDSALSLVLSAQCGLLTERTTEHGGRVKLIVYLELASMLAGLVILPVDAISSSLRDFRAFQICTGVVAVVATGFLFITGFFASDQVAQKAGEERAPAKHAEPGGNAHVAGVKHALRACKGILANTDFWCVVLGNFFHILRITGAANFLTIFTEALISPNGILSIGSIELSLFYTGCTVVSKAFLLMCWPLLHKFGAFACLTMTIVLTTINCVATAIIGRHNYSWLALYLLFDNIISRGLWPAVFNIFFPDVIDEDMHKHKRTNPLSTMIFTMNALFTKPAISLAPIIIVAVLNRSGYQEYLAFQKQLSQNSTALLIHQNTTTTMSSVILTPSITAENDGGFDGLFSTMFNIACFFPLACGVAELICFLPYRLKCRHRRDNSVEDSEMKPQQTQYGSG